uniref:Uncharacterized protein n=1 Tax=Cacopsylla melanoneura TaxID=428564 RepID=A0A8D8PUB4_9HEMI
MGEKNRKSMKPCLYLFINYPYYRDIILLFKFCSDTFSLWLTTYCFFYLKLYCFFLFICNIVFFFFFNLIPRVVGGHEKIGNTSQGLANSTWIHIIRSMN